MDLEVKSCSNVLGWEIVFVLLFHMTSAGLLLWPCLCFSFPAFFSSPQTSFSSPMAKRTSEWEENIVAKARTGTRDGRWDGEKIP